MGRRNRFVTPETVRLDLSDGDWIEVKERLDYAENQRLYGRMVHSLKDDDDGRELGLDLARFNIARLETCIVDWSFRGADDKPVPVSRNAIEHLDPDTAQEIDQAIEGHLVNLAAKKVLASAGTS